MKKYSPLLFVMIFSFLFGDANVQIRLQNGQKVQGEFVGTYMNHVHILVEEKIIYYACDDITSITYSAILRFDYDCSINTVTADILFPPELDPLTGEMTQMLPDVFNPDIPKPAVEKATSVIQNPAAKVETGGLSIEGKRIYNNKINKYYSHDELITFLDQDINFVGNKDFLKYKNSVQRLKFYCMIPVYGYSVIGIRIGIDNYNHPEENPENPEVYKDNFAVSVVVPLSYYTFNKVRRDKSLYYVVKNYNNLYSEEKLPDSKPPYTWSGGMSFGFQSEKTPVSLLNGYLLFRLNEHKEIFTGYGTILFGGSLFTGYKHYLNDFSKPSPYMSISYHGGSYFDSGSELTGIFPSLGYSKPISEETIKNILFLIAPFKYGFLNIGIGYVFMQKNTMRDFEEKKGFLAPFLNLSFNY